MNYVSVESFLKGRAKLEDLSPELLGNTNTIISKVNDLLSRFGQYRVCTSGYRRLEDQLKINPKAIHSKHLLAAAIDLEDKDGKLNQFCKQHPEILQELDLYLEECRGNWQHIQCLPFASYKPNKSRWFNP